MYSQKLAEVEKARAGLESQQTALVDLANAVIAQSVRNGNAQTVLLGSVLDEVKKGVGSTWAQYPVLGATRNGLTLAKEPVGKFPERYKPVFPGTVFYNPMRINIGSIAIVDEQDTAGITSPDYVALRGCEGRVDSRWFYYWLRSPFGERCIASLARGAVRERMLFNRLAEAEIELPDYSSQIRASNLLASIIPLKKLIEKQKTEVDLLPARLLAQVFAV